MQQQEHRPFFRVPNVGPDSAVGRVWRRFAMLASPMTLKTRAVLLVVSILIVGIWTLAVSVILVLERDLTRTLTANFQAEVKNVADDLDRDVQLHIDMLTRLAATLTPDILADPAKLDRALDQFSDASAIIFSTCIVANSKGIITAGYPEQAVRLGTSVGDLGYFREVVANGKWVIGAPVAIGKAQKDAAVPIAVPVRNGTGATVGALVGAVMLSDAMLFGQLEHFRLGQEGWFLVVSPKDRMILGATDRSRVMTALPGHGVIPLLDRRFEAGFEGAGITVASIGTEVLSVGHKMATTGWFVIASDPITEVLKPIKDIERWIFAVALVISLVVAVILRFFLTRQLAPLQDAGGVIRRMTEGLLPMTAIPVARTDEIGELIASFNRLVAERGRLEASLLTEIAERKQANETLQERTDRFDGIYRSVADGIISIDTEQRIVLFNTAAERIFGYPAADMLGQPLSVMLPERFRLGHSDHIRKFAISGHSNRKMGNYGLIYGRRASGEEFPLEAAVSKSGSAPNILFTVILRDITERTRAEHEREQLLRHLELLSERLDTAHEAERGKIAYELHEELGQELMTLKLYLQMLVPAGGSTKSDAYQQEALAVAVHAMERVRKLVIDLEPRELEDFGLDAAVRNYCQQKAEAGRWTLHLDAPKPGVRAPRAVERACLRVLQEGLNNVIHHAKATEVWVDLHQGDDELVLLVRDNGIGFDCSHGSREFDGHEGTSLGLFGLQIRAKYVGGFVNVTSAVGAGTEVRAVFPLSVEPV